MRRTLALFCVACLLPAVVLGSAFWIMLLRTQQTATRQLATHHTVAASRLIGRELASNLRSVQVISQSPGFDRGFDAARFFTLADRLVRDEPTWRAISVSDGTGTRLLDVPTPIGGRTGGKVVDRASLRQAVATRRPVIGSIVQGPRGNWAFAVRAPVVRGGKVDHVVSVVVDPQTLVRLLADESLPAGWTAELVDSSGRIVAQSGGRPRIGELASQAALRARRGQPDSFYRGLGLDGVEEVATWRRVAGADWTIHVAIPARLYGAPARQSGLVLALGGLLSLLLSGSLVLLLARELRQRRRSAEAAAERQRLEALGRMTGGVAHDFNNLLTPIIGGLDMLQRRAPDARASRLIEAALQSAERARTLVGRLLVFARRQPLQARPVNVDELVAGMGDLLERSLGPGVRVSIETRPDLPSASVDPSQLELAILNLALNAGDAMAGGGELRIVVDAAAGGQGLGADLPPGPYVRISVADTGSGMDAETLRRAVEPFFTTKPVGKGTGLGLSIAHGLAVQSGGGLFLTSQLGRGATVEVWLPAGPRVGPRSTESEPAVSEATAVLLLVDDDAMVRAATAALLSEHGHRVIEADSAAEALRLLKASPEIEAIVTDFAMPVRSGAELIADARRLRPDVPVLLITGYAGAVEGVPDDVRRLEKPFRRVELLAGVAAVLDKAGRRGQAAPRAVQA